MDSRRADRRKTSKLPPNFLTHLRACGEYANLIFRRKVNQNQSERCFPHLQGEAAAVLEHHASPECDGIKLLCGHFPPGRYVCAWGLGRGARPHIAAHTRRPAGASHPPGRKSSRALPLRPCGLSCVRNFPQWNFGPPMSVHRRALWPSRSRVAGGCTLSALLCAQHRHFRSLDRRDTQGRENHTEASRRAVYADRCGCGPFSPGGWSDSPAPPATHRSGGRRSPG